MSKAFNHRFALATLAADIAVLSPESARLVLLKVLAETPAVVAKVMDKENPMENPGSGLYDVVVEAHGGHKIRLIKLFREFSGHGLSESKQWSEGINLFSYRGGVFGSRLTRSEGADLIYRLNGMAHNNGFPEFKARIIKSGAPFTFPGYGMGSMPNKETIVIAKVSEENSPSVPVPASVPHPMYASDVA